MIPVSRPCDAVYKHTDNDGRPYYDRLSVEAWSDDGDALVVDPQTGRLRDARSYTNFARLGETDGPIVGVIPGGGWTLSTKDGATVEPVLGWTVTTTGHWQAYISDGEGYVEPVDVREGDERELLPPGGRP